MFLNTILNENPVMVADKSGGTYPGKFDNTVAYIMPYARHKSVLHEPNKMETYFRLVNNEDRPWQIFKDQLEFQTEQLKTFTGVNIHYSIKDGTSVLIDMLSIELDNIVVLKLSGNYLTIYPANLKQQLKNKKFTKQQFFMDIFHLTIDRLFY